MNNTNSDIVKLEQNWDNLTPAQKILVAVHNAKQFKLPGLDLDYLHETLAHRYENPFHRGSMFCRKWYNPERKIVDDETKLVEKALFETHLNEWKPYSHDGVIPGCEAFRLDSEMTVGVMGVIDVETELFDMNQMWWQKDHTGNIMLVYHQHWPNGGTPVKHAVVIIGIEDGKHVVFTVHPGDPIKPSSLSAAEHSDLVGRTPTMADYRKQLVRYAKIAWI